MMSCVCEIDGMSKFGEVVRALRERRKLSQEALAAQMGRSRQTIMNIEASDTPTLQGGTYRRLAEVLGTTTDAIDAEWAKSNAETRLEFELPADELAAYKAQAKAMGLSLRDLMLKALEAYFRSKNPGPAVTPDQGTFVPAPKHRAAAPIHPAPELPRRESSRVNLPARGRKGKAR
jgi:transcriptional regulator with XRE-family HTH domain